MSHLSAAVDQNHSWRLYARVGVVLVVELVLVVVLLVVGSVT